MSDMWNEMSATPHSVDEEYDHTWPYNFKWGFDPDTGRVDVWRAESGLDARPVHRREVEDRWGRPPNVQAGDVMGLATYIPAEIKYDGEIVAPPEIHTQTYYDKLTPPQVAQHFQEKFPHAIVRDAIIASKGQSKVAASAPALKWIWNQKDGLIIWQTDNDLPTHDQKAQAEWNRPTSVHSESDTIGTAHPDPEKVVVETSDQRPIPPAAFAAVKSQLAEWYPHHQIVGDNQEQREFGSDPVDYRSAALTWAWENLVDDPAERSQSSSEPTERGWRSLTRFFRKRVTADADMKGCMVALFVPEQAAKKLRPRGGEDIENMHITLLYFKDEARERDDWDEVKKLVEQIANQHPILRGSISGYGVFNSDEGDVLWASPSVQGLAELRHKLYEACTDAGFTIDSEHDWVPHITLKYDHRGKLPKPDEEISLHFDELSFAQGEKQRHYEFKGHLEKRAMAEQWPTLEELKRPWADANGYEPLGGNGDWFMGGGCAHLALAMKSLWPEGKIAAGWYDDHGRKALGHAAFYDPQTGHAWDGTGAHQYHDVAVSGHSGDIDSDVDPAELAEFMGINWAADNPWEDNGVYDGATFAQNHFMPDSYTEANVDQCPKCHTPMKYEASSDGLTCPNCGYWPGDEEFGEDWHTSSDKQGSAAPEPPNYRKQEKPSEACGLCKMMSDGKCWGYGNKPVEPDMVCDSFSPEKTSKKKTAADLPDWAHQPGVWYHVTSEDRLPQIAKEGLRPDTDARRFEHDYSPGVYLFGMPEQAYNWYRPEEWDLPIVLLRITGIPEDQVTPDPEMVQDYKEGEWQEMVEGSQPWWQHEQVVYQGTIPPEQIEWTYQTKETPFQKLAAGQVMYHVAPASARESISQHGLDFSQRPEDHWQGQGYGEEMYPKGNYLWVDGEDADEYVHTVGDPGTQWDIWEVNTDGLTLAPDPQDPGIYGDYEGGDVEGLQSYWTPEHIDPSRLKLVDTMEAKDWEDRYGKTSSEDYLDWSGWEGAHRFVTDGKEILTDPETERINDSQWRDSELEDKFRTIYPEAKSFVSGWVVPTADGMGLGIWAPAAGHGDKHEPGLHEIIGIVEKEIGKPTHLITNEEHLSDEGMYDPGIETTWQTLSHKLTKPN